MNTPLETILSQRGEAVPEQTTEEQVTQTATEDQGQQTEGQTEQQTEAAEGDGEGNRIPVAALQAERAKVKRYTEEVADFRKSNEALQRQVSELLQRVPVPKQEQAAAPDWFENPTEAMRHQMTQQLSPAFEQVNQTLQAIAKDNAIVRFTEEKVTAAEQAFLAAMQSRQLDPADYEKVVSSPNRYAAAVQWYERQQINQEIGSDPAAYKAKLEAEIREKVLAEINGGNGQQQEQPAQRIMPSNFATARNVGARSGPAWAGPPPITDIFVNHRTRR